MLHLIDRCQPTPLATTIGYNSEAEIQASAGRLFERHARRLRVAEPHYRQRVRLMATVVEQLRQLYTLAKRIAKTQIPPALAQLEA